MKKYLFGLGAMVVGAGLMFALMHGEVSAEGEADFDFICKGQTVGDSNHNDWYASRLVTLAAECKKGKTTCYYFKNLDGGGLSCFNTGMFK